MSRGKREVQLTHTLCAYTLSSHHLCPVPIFSFRLSCIQARVKSLVRKAAQEPVMQMFLSNILHWLWHMTLTDGRRSCGDESEQPPKPTEVYGQNMSANSATGLWWTGAIFMESRKEKLGTRERLLPGSSQDQWCVNQRSHTLMKRPWARLWTPDLHTHTECQENTHTHTPPSQKMWWM